MIDFETLTTAQRDALSPTQRLAWERWFWQWMGLAEATDTTDILTEQREGYAYD